MELRRLSLCLVFFTLAVYIQCSEAHSMQRRGPDDADYDGLLMGDEASDEETQNDDGGNDAEEEDSIPAVIQTLPTLYNVTVGRTIRLECKVDPADGAVIQWYRRGEPFFMGHVAMIPDSERFSIDKDSNDLLLSEVKPSDSGTYKCKVVQTLPAEIEHTLSVHEAPRIVRFSATDNGTVVEGTDLLLTCDVAGSPPPQIMWSKESDAGNVRLRENDGKYSLNSVFIENVRREQAGKYYCYAINGVGHAQAEINVRVLHKPRVQVAKTVVNSALGVEAVLQCAAHGDPLPSISWYKDRYLISADSTQFSILTEGAHSNLTVVPQRDQDFGTFTCEARNSHGRHNKSIELVQRPVVMELDVDGNKLSWKVHSHQPLEQIELQLRDMELGKLTTVTVPVPTGNGHEYEVIYVLENLDPGKYEAVVKAKNDKEWSRNSEPMIVEYEAQPMYIQHASVYRGNSHSIRPATSLLLSSMFMYLLVRMF